MTALQDVYLEAKLLQAFAAIALVNHQLDEADGRERVELTRQYAERRAAADAAFVQWEHGQDGAR